MKRKKLRSSIRKILLLVILSVISTCLGFYLQRKENYKNTYIDVNYNIVNTEKVYTASIVMVGDALFHKILATNNKTSNGYDFKGMFKYIKEIVEPYDLAYYNQETLLGGSEYGVYGYPQFNSPQEVGDAFIDAGFNLVSLANNHTMDRYYTTGGKTINSSLNYWKNKSENNNVITAGSYSSQSERDEVKVYEVNGIKYGFLAYTDVSNGINPPSGKGYLVNTYSDSIAKYDVLKLKDKVDLIIVSMHWGQEDTHNPNTRQKNIANYLSSIGVNLIIGMHSHVIQPVTYVNDTLVFYSLGNFVSNQTNIDNRTGLMANLEIKKSVYHGETHISFNNISGELIYNTRYEKYMVYPYSKLTNSILNDYKNNLSKYNNYINMYSKTLSLKGL